MTEVYIIWPGQFLGMTHCGTCRRK